LKEVNREMIGKDEKEKLGNFLAKQKAEIVVKAVFNYKLKKDETFYNETQIEMENEMNDEDEKLDESIYQKKDGKYTKEAMVKYLFEKKTGKSHQFLAKGQNKGSGTSTDNKGHWDEYKWWYIGGGIIVVLLVVGLVVYWDKLMKLNPDKEEE